MYMPPTADFLTVFSIKPHDTTATYHFVVSLSIIVQWTMHFFFGHTLVDIDPATSD